VTELSDDVQVPTHDEDVGNSLKGMFGRDGIYMALWAVQIGGAALFTPITTRVLGAGPFGEIAAAVAVMQIMAAVAGLHLDQSVQREYALPDGPAGARRIVTLTIVVSVLTWALAMATGRWWSVALGFHNFSDSLKIALTWAALTAITNAGLGILRSRDQLLPFAMVSLLQSLVAEGLSLALVLGVERSARAFLSGQLLAQAAAVTVALVMVRPLAISRRYLPMMRSAIAFSSALVPSALAAFVLNTSDRLVIQHHMGEVQTGRYQAAYNVGSLPMVLLTLLNTIWMPRVFAMHDPKLRAQVLAASRDSVQRAVLPVLLGLSIGSPILLHIWTPSNYRPDQLLRVTVVVVLSIAPYAYSQASQRVLLAAGRTWPLAWSIMVAAILNLGLNLVLVPAWGLMGAALSTLASFGVMALLTELASRRALRLPRMPLRLFVLTAGAGGVALLSTILPTTAPFLAVRLVLGLICLYWMITELLAAGRGETTPRLRLFERKGPKRHVGRRRSGKRARVNLDR